MDTREAIESATRHLFRLEGHVFDVLTLTKPVSVEAAVSLAKVISKLSPLLGNLIEINTVEVLNAKPEFRLYGKWIRQDPNFPDTVLKGIISPIPGFEIKAWFPLATEITARFKDSQEHFVHDNTGVVLLAWLPERTSLREAQNHRRLCCVWKISQLRPAISITTTRPTTWSSNLGIRSCGPKSPADEYERIQIPRDWEPVAAGRCGGQVVGARRKGVQIDSRLPIEIEGADLAVSFPAGHELRQN